MLCFTSKPQASITLRSASTLSPLDLDNVAQGELGGLHRDVFALPANHRVLGHQVLETLHDLGGLGLLVKIKMRMKSQNDDRNVRQRSSQTAYI